MKNLLIYNYGLEPEELIQNGDNYSFYVGYDKYYFLKVTRPIEDLKEIFDITKEKNHFHKFILNRSSSIFTEYEKNSYILFKIVCPENNEVDCIDLIKNMDFIDTKNTILLRNNWSQLWSEKVDYLEYQISELGTGHDLIRKSFSYYVGLAENAIQYFNLLDAPSNRFVLSRKRISYPLYEKEYNDPMNLVIDCVSRDFAGYFKAKFFYGENPVDDIKILAKKGILTPLEYNLLFCRLLYPSYYFDAIHEILENGSQDNILLPIIEKANKYETFLNEVFNIFKTKSSMIKIDWLIKKS